MSLESFVHSLSLIYSQGIFQGQIVKGIFFTPAKFCCYGMPCNAGQLYELWPVIQVMLSDPDHIIYSLLMNCKRN